jgi:hypothetical protein
LAGELYNRTRVDNLVDVVGRTSKNPAVLAFMLSHISDGGNYMKMHLSSVHWILLG